MNTPLVIAGVLFVAYLLIRMTLKPPTVLSPKEALAAVTAGTAVLVDVREAPEWSEGVAAPATLLALSDLEGTRAGWRPFLDQERGKRILLYCKAGGRAGKASALLSAEGFDAVNVGGYSDWVASGLPTRRP